MYAYIYEYLKGSKNVHTESLLVIGDTQGREKLIPKYSKLMYLLQCNVSILQPECIVRTLVEIKRARFQWISKHILIKNHCSKWISNCQPYF